MTHIPHALQRACLRVSEGSGSEQRQIMKMGSFFFFPFLYFFLAAFKFSTVNMYRFRTQNVRVRVFTELNLSAPELLPGLGGG